MYDNGTIRSGEAQSVVRDLLEKEAVPKATYSFRGRKLHMLVGSRPVQFDCSAGMSFYGLQATLRSVQAAIEDQRKARINRNQTDIEDAIRAAP